MPSATNADEAPSSVQPAAPVEAPAPAAASDSVTADTPSPAAEPSEQKLAVWEEIGPGVFVGDLALGVSYSNLEATDPAYAGSTGSNLGGFGWISVQLSVLSFLLDEFYADKRWRIEDYERLSTGIGAKSTSSASSSGVWFGVDYGIGAQGLFRVSNLLDVGARFYWGFFNDTNMRGFDKGSSEGVYFISGRARVGDVYLDYTHGLPTERGGELPGLNIVEARYVFDHDDGEGVGVRVDFAIGDNGQAPPLDIDATNVAVRLNYTYASF